MKESIRNKMISDFREILSEGHPGISESEARKIADELGGIATRLSLENAQGIAENYSHAVRELEAHKRMFREHVDDLQRVSKSLLEFFKKHGVVSVEFDTRTRRPTLKPKSTVMVGIVEYLKTLDAFIARFYSEVYRIDEKNNDERAQIKLF